MNLTSSRLANSEILKVATILNREWSHITTTILKIETIINAQIEHVWAIFTDSAENGAWNHFTPQVNCTGRVGDPVTLLTQLGRGNHRPGNLILSSPTAKSITGGESGQSGYM
jgi:hypothetical protein